MPMTDDLNLFDEPRQDRRIQRAASMLSIMLKKEPDRLSIQSLEFSSRGILTRCTFCESDKLSNALSPELCREIEHILHDVGMEIGFITKPDYRASLPGLILGKVRVLVTRARHGMRYINVRFFECIGNVAAVFSPSARPWQMGHDQSTLIAAETLERIFVPLMNFSNYLQNHVDASDDDSARPLADGLRATRRKINEMELYYNLLLDFVASNRTEPMRNTTLALGDLSRIEVEP